MPVEAFLVRIRTNTVATAKEKADCKGKVWLVGAGPGDADLLTVKALRVIQNAEVIVYDALVSRDIRAEFPASATCIYVGKRKGCHAISQSDLNQLLVDQASLGHRVCRLKGGDPSVFGRVGEEAIALHAAGIDYDVVPGISAANGVAAYAGIPLTHRGLAQSCTVVSMHSRVIDGLEQASDVNWSSLASSKSTLVFYMGLSRAEAIAGELIAHGLNAATPAAIVSQGCSSSQQVYSGQLHELGQIVAANTVKAPALIIVGEVVGLREKLGRCGSGAGQKMTNPTDIQEAAG
jgi:uroporphyrin-III C-methyltransferase